MRRGNPRVKHKDFSICATCMEKLSFEYDDDELFRVKCPTCGVKYARDGSHRERGTGRS